MPWRTLVAAGTLVVRDGKLLLARTSRDDGERWEIAAGHQEPGEALEETAARHMFAASGIGVQINTLACTYLLQDRTAEQRVLCAYFVGEERAPDILARPQGGADVVETMFLDPMKLTSDEIHPIDHAIIRRWWPERAWIGPFHLHWDR